MKYRSRTDIVSQILKSAAANGSGGITKSRIMYKAFLSYDQLREYLRMLVESNLLSYDLDGQTFKTTEKGHKFLQTYNQMEEAIRISSKNPNRT
jgi:predicted transcriptional regulator